MIRAMFNKTIPWASVCHIYYLFFLPPFLVPSNNPALCHISGNIHTLSLPSPPLIKTWEQTTSFWSGRLCSRATFEVEKKAKKSRRRRREKKRFQWHLCWLEECIPVCLRCVILHDISIMRGTDTIFSVRSALLFKYISALFPERVNYN